MHHWRNLLTISVADADEARRRKLLNIILSGLLILTLVGIAAITLTLFLPQRLFTSAELAQMYAVSGLVLVGVIIIFLVNRFWSGFVASTLFLALLTAAVLFADTPRQLVEGRSLLLFLMPILMASVLLRSWASFAVALAELLVVSALGMGVVGISPPLPTAVTFLLFALLSWLAARSLEEALRDLRLVNQEVNALYRASAQLLNPTDVSGITRQIVQLAISEFKFADCGVMLLNEGGTALVPAARAGEFHLANVGVMRLDGPGLMVAAARSGDMVYAPDVTRDARYLMGDPRTRSELVIPLRSGSQVLGVLDLQSPRLNAFDERARRLLTSFAESASLALENTQLVERLDRARQVAEEASRLKSEFLANTSHELRTPLTSIIYSLGMVLDDLCTSRDEERELLRIAYTASENLLSIINTVLDIAKIEAGEMDVHLEAVEGEPVITEVLQMVKAPAEGKNLYLQCHLPSPLPRLWVDATRLKQILLNLLSNAVKFTEEGGVTVRAQVDSAARMIQIEVQDTGIGIAPDKQNRLFKPFVQVNGSTTRKYGGTGLGLSISRRLAEMLGGSLTLYSAGEGQGCTLTLRLPLARDDLPT